MKEKSNRKLSLDVPTAHKNPGDSSSWSNNHREASQQKKFKGGISTPEKKYP